MKKLHINCDLGEGGKFDKQLMPLISACNIACGGHAGNLETMQHTVDSALENHLEIGAHPGYPDKQHFGRISVTMDPVALKRSLVAQILSLKQIIEAEGGVLNHVKPHGALYNEAQKDEKIAAIILEVIEEFDGAFKLYAPQDSVISAMAEGRVEVVFEAFGDRNYQADHSLVSRLDQQALITEKEAVFEHLSRMFYEHQIQCITGERIPCRAQTFCIHSDTPNAVEILKYVHWRMQENSTGF